MDMKRLIPVIILGCLLAGCTGVGQRCPEEKAEEVHAKGSRGKMSALSKPSGQV